MSLKARVKRLARRLAPSTLCDCPPPDPFVMRLIDWRKGLELFSPDPEVRAVAQRRQDEENAKPCDRCGRERFTIRVVAVDYGHDWNYTTSHDERSDP